MPQSRSVITERSTSEYSVASVSTWITGGMLPSLVRCSFGSTPSVPSCSDQKVHIGTFGCTLPSRPLTVIAAGSSSMSQICLTQGPAPMTTQSQSTFPWSVTTVLTAPEVSLTKPVTLTPVMMRTPSYSALAARPPIEALMFAYPTFFSFRLMLLL